jgi:hypothetical protein
MEDYIVPNENIDMEKMWNAGKNVNISSIVKPIHSLTSAIAA